MTAAPKPSEVRVGQVKMPVVDAVARVINLSGNPSLDVYLFSQPLDPALKAAILEQPVLNYSTIAARTGQAPVLNLQFIFDAEAKKCSKGDMLTYTAVFEKSSTFNFESARNNGINFSADKADGGVSELTCEFQSGSAYRLKVRRTITADRNLLPSLLPPGKTRLVFSWDIDLAGEVTKGL